MTFNEFRDNIKALVLSERSGGIDYSEEDVGHIEKFIKKGYFIDGFVGEDRTLVFTRRLIVDIKKRRK